MPKRTAQEKIAKYEAKIRKLMDVHKRRSSRVIYSDDDENPIEEQIQTPIHIEDDDSVCHGDSYNDDAVIIRIEPDAEPGIGKEQAVPSTSAQPLTPLENTDLDPNLLLALGESMSDVPDFGPSIHDSLAKLWQPILRKGLVEENRDSMFKTYRIPENCRLLLAPKLNAEISSAVPNVARGRDKKLHTFQQQLGTGVSAINKGMDVLLKSENKVEALKSLSDSCRILSDLHFSLSKYRIKLITPSLDKKFLHVLQDTERDDLLFGTSLSEKIKASKAIEKQGQQIKKNVTVHNTAAISSTAIRPSYVPPGNWSAPPHYHYPSTTRGGRGGARRPLAAASRKPHMNSAFNKTSQSKGRAQPHQ